MSLSRVTGGARVGGGGDPTHAAATTGVHGIADTSLLATEAYVDSAVAGAGGNDPTALKVLLWDDDDQAYPARPAIEDALVCRYIGPIEPTDWLDADEWRSGYGIFDAPALAPNEVTGLVQWLKADALALADNAAVATWTASAGGNATQATGSAQPVFKTGVVNGLPAVRFDGSTDFLSFAALGANLTQYAIFAVVKHTGAQGNILSQDTSGFSNDLLFGVDPENGVTTDSRYAACLQRSSDSSRQVVTDTTGPPSAGYEVLALWYDGTTLKLYRNDGATPISTAAAISCTIADRTWNVGRRPGGSADSHWGGDICEVAIYSTAIAEYDLAGVVRHLNEKYGL